MKLLNSSLAIFGAAALFAATGHAALVLDYQYNGTNGTQTPNPTLDTSGAGPTANGTLASGVTYATGNSPNPIGSGTSHIDFTSVATGTGINFTSTGASVLNNVPAATLFTDFRLSSNTSGAGNEPRFFFLSTNSAGAARAEIRLNLPSATTAGGGTYTFRAGGRAADGNGFQNFTSTAVTINLDTWYSLATVLDYTNRTIEIFFNGDSIGKSGTLTGWTAGNTSSTNSALALIGANGGTSPAPSFSGDLDNTRIYNTALSASAIQNISIPEPSTGLMLLGGLGMLTILRRRARR